MAGLFAFNRMAEVNNKRFGKYAVHILLIFFRVWNIIKI